MTKRFQRLSDRHSSESPTDRQERIKWWDQQRLREANVMVIGAGALGNEVLKNLALMGVGYVLVVDCDEIERSNLSRTALFRQEDLGQRKAVVAAARAQQMNVETTAVVEALDADVVWEVGAGVFRRIDIVLGCLDNLEARQAAGRACLQADKPYIDGGIRELAGSVYAFGPPYESCINCTTTARERSAAGNRYDSCFQVLLKGFSAGKIATVQLTSAIVAGMQVEHTIKWLHQRFQQNSVRIQYDGGGLTPYFDVTKVSRRHGCDCNHLRQLPEPVAIPNSREQLTLQELLVRARDAGLNRPVVKFPCSFVPNLFCSRCNLATDIMQPLYRLASDQLQCQNCQTIADRTTIQLTQLADSLAVTEETSSAMTERIMTMSLQELGFPLLAIVQIDDLDSGSKFFEIAGDAQVSLPGLFQRKERA